jgi:hypothetical protein
VALVNAVVPLPGGDLAAYEAYAGASRDPVFVLCMGRSGSTLLRLLLDTHPDLGCPPETKFPEAIARMARMWSSMEGLARPEHDGSRPGELAGATAQGLRLAADLIVGPYLAGRGKRRYCDKNLGTARHADLLVELFPEVKFVCLYRHPMDVIASGIEACPWGLSNYGFEPYAAAAPGNAVLAVARYWADHAAGIMEVEEKYPDRCHRVRYEDLVTDPDAVAGGVFEFLGVAPVSGIEALAFSEGRERFGAGDFKIWNTSEVTDDSVGRGWGVPAGAMKPVLPTVNELAGKLGYRLIDDAWGAEARPGDLRVAPDGQALARQAAPPPPGPVPPGTLLVSRSLTNGLQRVDEEFTRDWAVCSEEPFVIVALSPGAPGDDTWWLVSVPSRQVTTGTGRCDEEAAWTVIGPAATWELVIRDGLNLGSAFRRHGMRYTDHRGGAPGSVMAEHRVAMMSNMLGINSWRPGTGSTLASLMR